MVRRTVYRTSKPSVITKTRNSSDSSSGMLLKMTLTFLQSLPLSNEVHTRITHLDLLRDTVQMARRNMWSSSQQVTSICSQSTWARPKWELMFPIWLMVLMWPSRHALLRNSLRYSSQHSQQMPRLRLISQVAINTVLCHRWHRLKQVASRARGSYFD